MLRPVQMRKVKVIAPLKRKDEIFRGLHGIGATHINDISSRIKDAEWSNIIVGSVEFRDEEKLKGYVSRLDDVHAGFLKIVEPKVMKKLSGARVNVSERDERDVVFGAEKILDSLEEEIGHLTGEIENDASAVEELSERKAIFELLRGVEFSLDEMKGEVYSTRMFRVAKDKSALLLKKLKAAEGVVAERTDAGKDTFVLVTFLNEKYDKIGSAFGEAGAEEIEIPLIDSRSADELRRMNKRIALLEEKKKKALGEAERLFKKYRHEIVALKEELGIIIDRYSALKKCVSTDNTFILEFFVKKSDEKRIVEEVKRISNGQSIIYSIEPLTEERAENVPVVLSNPFLIRPFEALTRMFSIPKYNDFDPTIFLAPGMMLFFGIMLNDVGYGLLLGLVGFLMYVGHNRIKIGSKDVGVMLGLLGLSCVFFGVLTGSYFGDALRQVFPGIPYFVDPLGEAHITVLGAPVENSIIFVMLFSLACGVMYINVGFIIGIFDAIYKIRVSHNGKKTERMVDRYENQILGHAGMMVFQMGLFGLLFHSMFGLFAEVGYFSNVCFGLMVVSILMLAKSGGVQTLFGFFDLTGFLGDDLSFIRLLALCLATEGISNVINMFTVFSFDIPFVGVLIGSFVFAFGHVFNLLVGALGAGIHSLRLQYVEFFSKFYDGGGVEFEAYSVKRKDTLRKG